MKLVDPRVSELIDMLQDRPQSDDLFSPWWEVDPDNDISEDAPAIRREQLGVYLSERLDTARYLLVGEATGYQGGHFTGIAMTSERLLLGGLGHRGVKPEQVFTTLPPRRTSKPSVKKDGFSEPTATIVWSHLAAMEIDTYRIIIWNSCPWHTWSKASAKGMLSNRTPRTSETLAGEPTFRRLLAITNIQHILAVGRRAQVLLNRMNIDAPVVRHPAMQGANDFRRQFTEWYHTHPAK